MNRREQTPDCDPTIPNQFYDPLTSVFAILNSYARQRANEHNEMVQLMMALRAGLQFIASIDDREPINGLQLAKTTAQAALDAFNASNYG